MRTFGICGRSLDSGPGGTNSLLDFLFNRSQRIVRDVQRPFLYFGFRLRRPGLRPHRLFSFGERDLRAR